MSQIQYRTPLGIALVENVVPEEFEIVAFACFGPGGGHVGVGGVGGEVGVLVVVGGGGHGHLGPFEHDVEFGEEADEAAVFELAHEVV
ncbi:hypothetical protein LTR33_013821, partial [Friedmanniomyces endolithicus]